MLSCIEFNTHLQSRGSSILHKLNAKLHTVWYSEHICSNQVIRQNLSASFLWLAIVKGPILSTMAGTTSWQGSILENFGLQCPVIEK